MRKNKQRDCKILSATQRNQYTTPSTENTSRILFATNIATIANRKHGKCGKYRQSHRAGKTEVMRLNMLTAQHCWTLFFLDIPLAWLLLSLLWLRTTSWSDWKSDQKFAITWESTYPTITFENNHFWIRTFYIASSFLLSRTEGFKKHFSICGVKQTNAMFWTETRIIFSFDKR